MLCVNISCVMWFYVFAEEKNPYFHDSLTSMNSTSQEEDIAVQKGNKTRLYDLLILTCNLRFEGHFVLNIFPLHDRLLQFYFCYCNIDRVKNVYLLRKHFFLSKRVY